MVKMSKNFTKSVSYNTHQPYQQCTNRKQKLELILKIISVIHSQKGKFIKKCSDGWWVEETSCGRVYDLICDWIHNNHIEAPLRYVPLTINACH